MRAFLSQVAVVLLFASLLSGVCVRADEPAKPDAAKQVAAKPVDKETLYKKFEESMKNVKLVGNFTIRGRDNDKLPRDEYTILSATKMENGDFWLIQARIKYGNHDVTLPMPLEVKWAGNTPVITLDNVTIPGLGTFSSRVVIDGSMYAGTWTHDKVGGHMFGTIEKVVGEKSPGNENDKAK